MARNGKADSSMHHPHAPSRRTHCYGEFPELFWDLRPDAAIDAEHPSILARLLVHGTPDTISKLVSLDVLRRELGTLPVPEHTRRFWRVVLDLTSEAPPLQTS